MRTQLYLAFYAYISILRINIRASWYITQQKWKFSFGENVNVRRKILHCCLKGPDRTKTSAEVMIADM